MCSRASKASTPRSSRRSPRSGLKALTEKFLSEDEKKQIEALGGWDKLMETLHAAARRAEKTP
ncbi:MAG: hypothetical protein WDM81_00840 [Rhizomicrobium sp.]